MFVIASLASLGALKSHGLPCASAACIVVYVITQFSPILTIRFNSHLIYGIPNVLQKLHNYFNGTANSISFVLPLSAAFPLTCLKLKRFRILYRIN